MMQRKFVIYKLHFTTPIHIGDSKEDYGTSLQSIASDTMYAALTANLAKMSKKIPDNGDLGFVISSLFPFYQKDANSNSILFFPKPLKQSQESTPAMMRERKKVKKVRWIDVECLEKALRGDELFDENNLKNNINSSFLTKEKIDNCEENFVHSQVMNRVTIKSRIGEEDAVPYYIDRVTFKDYSGLFFIVEGKTEMLDEAMSLLQEEGIGTDRNVGNGFFKYDKCEMAISLPENANCAYSLSMFMPESKGQLEEYINDKDKVAYEMYRRGGWITTYPHNTMRKNVIYAFSAGSVFSHKVKGVETAGKIVDLRPHAMGVDHPIWRCGRTILLPMKVK